MRFSLKDFQDDAVAQLLTKLQSARLLNEAQGVPVSVSLTATTGAGKTVMASAIIENLFFGSDRYNFDADHRAVILWVTDDPSLNEQTRWRFMESSELIDLPRLKVIGEGFDQESFDTQMVYFLNRQKLATSSNLVKVKDTRNYTLWQTIQNTIEHPDRNLYMVLDEAHRGLGGRGGKRDENERQTIYAQLIDGADGRSPMPIVLGISATIERFSAAMESRNRMPLGTVAVDPADVQASGLLKDTITLLIPDEAGSFDAVLLKEACAVLEESRKHWQVYTQEQGMKQTVKPLMVIQVPNLVSDDELFELCYQLMGNLPWLDGRTSFAHVLGDREGIILGAGKYLIRKKHPQDVQDDYGISILFAKEAISTGWDCPRAEVLFSLRPGQDKTYITQLVGRMVRAPLARRIEGNDVLNSVACFLPRFNRATTQEVASYLTGDLAFDDSVSQVPDRKVLTSPVTLVWNDALGEDVAEAFEALPTILTPRRTGSQIERILNLAGKLALYGIDGNVIDEVNNRIIRLIESRRVFYDEQYAKALDDVLAAETTLTEAFRQTGEIRESHRSIVADKAIIEAGFAVTSRLLTKEIAIEYLKFLIDRQSEPDYLEAKIEIAAVALVPEIVEELEADCAAFADELFARYRDHIAGLNDRDLTAFDDVKRRALEPQEAQIKRPQNDMVNSREIVGEQSSLLPARPMHVLSDPETQATPVSLNELEMLVVDRELAREDTVAWYRNPSGVSKSALQIPWLDNGKWRSMQPDFIFFSRMADGSVKPSIIDPHGSYLGDAAGKLKGFIAFAQKHGSSFKRLESVDRIDEKVLYLDLSDAAVAKAVADSDQLSAKDLYLRYGREYA
jgi:hypothetical protein